jgi:hypothetical protein
MPATLATVEAYLTAAQTALSGCDYAEARKQAVLAQMELAKIPASHGADGMQTVYRTETAISSVFANLDKIEAKDGTRQVIGVWGGDSW